MTTIAARLRTALLALLAACTLTAHAKAGDPALAGEVLVKLQSGATLAPLMLKYQLSLLDRFGSRPIFRLKAAPTADVDSLVATLALEPGVLIAERNYIDASPEARKNNVWTAGSPQAYAGQWAPQAIRLASAQALSTGAGTRVAVLDTGVDRTHPALAGRLLPGNDFVDADADPSEVGTHANPAYGHGTHVAGLIALTAPGARIMPLRVLDAQGQGNAWVLLEAMLYAIDPDGNPATDDGVQVINLSLGSLSRTHLFDAISQLATCTAVLVADPGEPVDPALDLSDAGYNGDRQRCGHSAGAVVVAAAGNDGSKDVRQYPAAESAYGKLAVGASTSARKLAAFSNSGSWVDLAAPGEGITSSVPGGLYATWSGTSMATPLASGTAALLRSLNPQMTAKDVVRRLARTTSLLCGTNLRQLDAYAALTNSVAASGSCR